MHYRRALSFLAFIGGAAIALSAQRAQQTPQTPQQQPPSQSEVSIKIDSLDPSIPPKLAVPDFIPLTSDAETQAAARTIGQVLWDDLNFEREFYLIARDTYRTIPQPPSLDTAPIDRWKELGADGVVIGTVRKTAAGVTVQFRLVHVASGRSAMAREYTGSAKSIQVDASRQFAHTIADEIHKEQRGLNGVARTKIAFASDRDNERIKGPVGDRAISNIYFADYDGARQQRVTATRSLDISPTWAPDGRTIAMTSYRSGYPDVYLIFPYELKQIANPTRGSKDNHNYLPVWSPDGTKIAFTSVRDGNHEIYVMNRDGSGVRRVTSHPSVYVTPTWSPTGTQIAFTSDRTGSPQIYIINADGTGTRQITRESFCDRPTWSPVPYNEIAYASREGGGYNIRVYDFETNNSRPITDGIGSNESPAFAPNGRHLAFVSTRAGKEQVFTIARDGRDLRQITRTGANRYPNWSR
jgi:TolB protein